MNSRISDHAEHKQRRGVVIDASGARRSLLFNLDDRAAVIQKSV